MPLIAGAAGVLALAVAGGAAAFFLLGNDEAPAAQAPTPAAAAQPADAPAQAAPAAAPVQSFNARNPWIQPDTTTAASSGTAGTTVTTGSSAYTPGTTAGSAGTSTVRSTTTGATAAHGVTGAQGAKGDKGDPGQKGDAGTPGKDGAAGQNGMSLGAVIVTVNGITKTSTDPTSPWVANVSVTTFGQGARGTFDPADVSEGAPLNAVPGDPFAKQVIFFTVEDAGQPGVWDDGDTAVFTIDHVPYRITHSAGTGTFFVPTS